MLIPRCSTSVASFEWNPGGRPSRIEPHSKAKLEVLRAYLRQYFELASEHLSKIKGAYIRRCPTFEIPVLTGA